MAQSTTTRLLERSYNTEILLYQILNSVLPKSCFTVNSVTTYPSHYQLHSSWVIDARQREEAFSKRNHVISDKYNRHAKTLPSLSVGTTVDIQNRGKKHQRRWIRSGIIVETLPNRQYRVRTNGSGRVTLQNRRFLRPATFVSPTAIPTPTNLLPASPLETTPPTIAQPTAPMPTVNPAIFHTRHITFTPSKINIFLVSRILISFV